MNKSFTERRKILNDIPEGMYCYEAISYNKETFTLKTKTCKYWESIGDCMAKCNLYDIKDDEPQSLTLLWDQVKICDLKRLI